MAPRTWTAGLATLGDAWYRRRFALAVGCLLAIGAASLLAAGSVWPLGRVVEFDTPQPDGGHAYVSKLSRPDLSGEREPIDSFLYEIHTDRGLPAFNRLNQRWGWSLAYLSLRARILAKYPDFEIERRVLVGPGNTHHEDVRGLGGGRYSIWRGSLHFSTPDNSSPLSNGRRYELFVPFFRLDHMSLAGAWLWYGAVTLLILTMLRVLAERSVFRRVLASTAPGVFVSVVMLVVAIAGFEIYQRIGNRAFPDAPWPMRFDPVAGVMFERNAEIRWSNQLDFWTRERTNSLGFLDREPVQPKPTGRFRIMIVGDSFVEAAQVRNADKLQTRLAEKLDASLGAGRSDVVAVALSGTGQANQIALYEAFGRQLSPDLVVLLAVSNDFADNSPLLSAVRYGWRPSHPPWFFFAPEGSGFRPLAPVEDWARFKLTGVDPAAFFASLIQVPEYASRLAGWGGPTTVDMDAMFFRRDLPPAFQEAIAMTRHALEEWKVRAARDGFRLLVVATSNLTRGEVDSLSEGTLYLNRFREVVSQVGLPFLDLYPIFAKQPDRSRGSWQHDSHWNKTGHQWAADALYEYLTEAGFLPNGTLAATK